ncbi:MAG: sigma-54 dependent transcriptional regulator [Pseudomonadota bacterium]
MAETILIVDDEDDIRALIRGILEDEGYQILEAANSTDAYAVLEKDKPDLLILDIWLQGSEKDGMEILESLKELTERYIPTLMISGHGTIETAVTAIKQGAYDFIEKPFKSDRLLLMITRALETARLRNENRILKNQSKKDDHKLIGDSNAIRNIRNQIEKIAPNNSRVLIKGEGGTGKEIIARDIHLQSTRRDEVFMALNCAALHPERLETELFGVQDKGEESEGVLSLCHGGTLFLDEVVDMPLETQGKILRVLQENQFFPVGSHTPIKTDVRVISSTNRDIDLAIQKGDFREDLLYRLNVVTLEVLPLRERREDILPLTNHFLQFFADQTGTKLHELSKTAKTKLKSYSWPGNVRQLKNVMEWITIMNQFEDDADLIEERHFPPEITGKLDQIDNSEAVDYFSFPLREARENFEKDYLTEQMKRFNGNISQTAEFIGMERSALHRKLKSLDISLDDEHNTQKRQVA